MPRALLAFLPLLAACESGTKVGEAGAGPVAVDDTDADTGADDTGAGGDTGDPDDTDTADTGGGDTADTADTGEPPLLIQAYGYEDCDAVDCTWYVLADGPVGGVALWLLETGSDAWESGCTDLPPVGGGTVCGVWSEHHTRFPVTDTANEYGGETRTLVLAAVTDTAEQVANATTVYGPSMAAPTMTWLIEILDVDGAPADCVAFGHDPRYFGSLCRNNW